jgi:hypothetical protein
MKLPKSYYNPVSLLGSILASVSFLIILFFLISQLLFNIQEDSGSYVGLFIYIVLPIFLIIGLILIPVGMSRRSKRLKREGDTGKMRGIVLDLTDQRQWNAVAIFIIVTIFFLLLTGIGSYRAFHFTESNEFCGTLCHKVMEPEYTAYQGSAHARVTCVECHVGEGANWYVRSKLSGLYQVYSVLFDKYPRPIETPIRNLRPARETCERCHWPEKFYSYRLENERHYLADSANTEWNIQLEMKIGSEHGAQGLLEGIHWHINPNVKIEYISSDDKREFIPWVRYINAATNDTVVFQDIYEPLKPEAMDTLEIREMDCLDCHNRPSHHYLPPQEFTDMLIASGEIPVELPEIKSLAMQVFNTTFTSRDSGYMMIEERAIAGFKAGFDKNMFPVMNVSWDHYPNQIGHMEFNGCFRCHNGNHENEDGEIISRDCNLCHDIVGQGTKDNFMTTNIDQALEFVHPVDIDEAWKEFTCADCHRELY